MKTKLILLILSLTLLSCGSRKVQKSETVEQITIKDTTSIKKVTESEIVATTKIESTTNNDVVTETEIIETPTSKTTKIKTTDKGVIRLIVDEKTIERNKILEEENRALRMDLNKKQTVKETERESFTYWLLIVEFAIIVLLVRWVMKLKGVL